MALPALIVVRYHTLTIPHLLLAAGDTDNFAVF